MRMTSLVVLATLAVSAAAVNAQTNPFSPLYVPGLGHDGNVARFDLINDKIGMDSHVIAVSDVACMSDDSTCIALTDTSCRMRGTNPNVDKVARVWSEGKRKSGCWSDLKGDGQVHVLFPDGKGYAVGAFPHSAFTYLRRGW